VTAVARVIPEDKVEGDDGTVDEETVETLADEE